LILSSGLSAKPCKYPDTVLPLMAYELFHPLHIWLTGLCK